jgi:predicted DNA binding CopG/RHH family protein
LAVDTSRDTITRVAADAFINCRVAQGTKARVRAVAARRGITESALVKELLAAVLQNEAVPEATAQPADRVNRSARLYVRLEPEDWRCLKERASARGMPSATYVSLLVRSHLRGAVPLPRAEYLVLKQAAGELNAMGRNLNQIAHAMTDGAAPGARGLSDVRTMLKVALELREHIRALLDANAKSWRGQPERSH